VDGNRAATGQRRKVDPVPAAAQAQLDAVMRETLAGETLAHAGAFEKLHGTMFEHAGAHAMIDVVGASCIDDDRLDAFEMQQMREQQSCRSRADDAHLRAHWPSARTAARRALCAPSGGSERSERGGPLIRRV